jgi:hypothetical protein
LSDDGDVSAVHEPGGKQPGVHGHGLDVTAERLPDRHGRHEPTRVAQGLHRPGEPQRQRAAVGHDVDRAGVGPLRPEAREDRRDR